ncbi:hypothetical protein E4T38_01803 [Aureobasidium subglaciale]|nr:hypothetical protein E4T38_01803 [Aureobasidium subglaciale]KAI5229249.1 hypothetical protein E4T40_01677 [Aureobasidium subglaciale]KAI5233001.1 hypothetical protein E4T41_01801 [Aureobasidium subglaciale]KAI5266242.1 hypothetical protein E4T46_01674 [Aureobasidium subglaciale]
MVSSKHNTTLLQPWLSDLKAGYNKSITTRPNYYLNSPSKTLITTSNLHSLHLGTGESILKSLIPLLESANEEVVLVTCFWATSASQKLINEVLKILSEKAVARDKEIRSLAGKVYEPESWQSALQLPAPEELQGLDMVVKSIFLLPFSVMHPKFIIIDRKIAVLPSCNVSWEDWFEGAVVLSGSVVSCFVDFWREFWAQQEDRDELLTMTTDLEQGIDVTRIPQSQPGSLLSHTALALANVTTIFLPSPHNRNPGFTFPWQDYSPPPPTPLNTFFLRSLAAAERNVYIQTPNLTSPPVLTAILHTLQRGIDIHIITSERLMILEQLVTAGTTTSRCISRLVSRYNTLLSPSSSDLEAGTRRPGKLSIGYFEPRKQGDREPRQSHFKCTIVDEELVILGSGNLDRASWYTSQELGCAFLDSGFAGKLKGELERALEGRVKRVL